MFCRSFGAGASRDSMRHDQRAVFERLLLAVLPFCACSRRRCPLRSQIGRCLALSAQRERQDRLALSLLDSIPADGH